MGIRGGERRQGLSLGVAGGGQGLESRRGRVRGWGLGGGSVGCRGYGVGKWGSLGSRAQGSAGAGSGEGVRGVGSRARRYLSASAVAVAAAPRAGGRPGWAARAPSAALRRPPPRAPLALRLGLRRPLGPPLPRRRRRRPPHVGRGPSPPCGRPVPGLAASPAARAYAASVAGEGPAPTAQPPDAAGRADVTARGGARRRARRFAAAGGAARRPPRFAAAR